MRRTPQTHLIPVLIPRALLVLGIAGLTLNQILRPGVNQDVRFVLGSFGATAGAGLSWTDTWAHRPMTARALMALLDAASPGEFWAQEAWIRFWSVLLAAGAAALLWRGLAVRFPPRVSAWTAIAVGAAMAWAPGWDFAEPEWYATVFAIAAVGIALRKPWGPLIAGVLLAVVIGLKFTTIVIAAAAVIAIFALDRRRGPLTGMMTVLATAFLLAVTILVEPREWQWMWDMPSLNPEFSPANSIHLAEGLINSLVVSPVTIGGFVAIAFLIIRGGEARRSGFLLLLLLVILALPFVVQQQNFLYHLSAVPVASAAMVAAVASHAPRTPLALPATGILGFVASAALFRIGPRTRDANWWIADIAIALVLAAGMVMMLVEIRRGSRGPRADTPLRRLVSLVTVTAACLVPLLVTVLPWTAYSFSLAHSRTTADSNLEQALTGPDRRADLHASLPPEAPVIYLSFSAPYWMGNPTRCVYASPTFLQRATGERGHDIAQTQSYRENLACLEIPSSEAVVIERGWFDLDRVRPEVRSEIARNFDCTRPLRDDAEWLICPSR